MNIIYRLRVMLIQIGKVLPFLLCMLVIISNAESGLAMALDRYVIYDGSVIPYKPVSWFIGTYCEYNIQMLVVLWIISIAIETCVWNKLVCAYLTFNLFEKEWFLTHTYDSDTYYMIIVFNVILASILVYNGIKRLNLYHNS